MTWLKYAGVAPSMMPVQRQFGVDVPVSVTAGYSPSNPPLYWRLDDPKFNLIEIGIDRRDGHLVSLTVVFCKEVVRTLSGQTQVPPGGESNGLPLFSLDLWAAAFVPNRDVFGTRANFYDVPGRCRLELGSEAVRVVLSSDEIHHRVVTTGGIVSEFNASDQLCAVLLPNVTQPEIRMLEESLRSLGVSEI